MICFKNNLDYPKGGLFKCSRNLVGFGAPILADYELSPLNALQQQFSIFLAGHE
jgi:hypothetical protein